MIGGVGLLLSIALPLAKHFDPHADIDSHRKFWDWAAGDLSLVITLGIGAICFLALLSYVPYKINKEDNGASKKTIDGLQHKQAELEERLAPKFIIEGIESELISKPEGCQIRFINKAGDRTAENPHVELVDLVCAYKSEESLPFPFPLTVANPKRVDWVEIHSEDHEDYFIFIASFTPADRRYKIWVRLPKPAHIRKHENDLYYLGFDSDVEYVGNVRISARGFPAPPLPFKVKFVILDGKCRFTLNQV